MISHVNFSSKLRNTNVLNSNVKNKKDNDKSSFENKNLLVMGLGALAISGIAFVMINKLKHPGKTGKDSQQISHKFFKYSLIPFPSLPIIIAIFEEKFISGKLIPSFTSVPYIS